VRAEIDARILEWMREPLGQFFRHDDRRFDRLARELFAFQYEHCLAYRHFCDALGRAPGAITSWREIPAAPTDAFKELRLCCFPEDSEVKTFRTSGTSSGKRGELHLDTLELYEASLLPTLRALLFPEVAELQIRVLAPSPEEAPDSSLSHMFGALLAALGSRHSAFDVRDGELLHAPLEGALEAACRQTRPVALCGTAFAFVHLLDGLEARGRSFALPEASRVMETGGFKGRSREVSRADLYATIEQRLGVPEARIVNQYGMTELGSQFYDSVLARPGEVRRKLAPPWARVRVVDPESGLDLPPGEVGTLVIHDLANTGSIAAIQTADLGRLLSPAAGEQADRGAERDPNGGFEVLGRATGAEARGCSIAADLLLAGVA